MRASYATGSSHLTSPLQFQLLQHRSLKIHLLRLMGMSAKLMITTQLTPSFTWRLLHPASPKLLRRPSNMPRRWLCYKSTGPTLTGLCQRCIISQDDHPDSLGSCLQPWTPAETIFPPQSKAGYNPYFKVLDSFLKILTLSFIPVEVKHGSFQLQQEILLIGNCVTRINR